MGTEGDYDVKRPLRDVIGTLLELVLPAEQRNLIPRLTDMVSACKGVVEHRGKLWGELSEGESNIVATRVGAIAREILGTGRSAETGEPQKKRRRRSRPLSMRGGGALAVKPTSPPSRMLVTGGVPVLRANTPDRYASQRSRCSPTLLTRATTPTCPTVTQTKPSSISIGLWENSARFSTMARSLKRSFRATARPTAIFRRSCAKRSRTIDRDTRTPSSGPRPPDAGRSVSGRAIKCRDGRTGSGDPQTDRAARHRRPQSRARSGGVAAGRADHERAAGVSILADGPLSDWFVGCATR